MVQNIDPDALNIVTDPSHILYQKDAANDPPEWMVMSAFDHGIFTPITIRKGPVKAGVQTWDIVVGRKRTKSARRANAMRRAKGLMNMTIPCVEFKGTDAEALALMAAENAHRSVPDAMTRAEAAATALKFGATEAKVMNDNLWTRTQLDQHLALLRVSPRVQATVMDGKMQLAAVPKLAKLGRAEQDEAVEKLIAAGKTGPREVDNAVTADNPGSKLERPTKPKPLRTRKAIDSMTKSATAALEKTKTATARAEITGIIKALEWMTGEQPVLHFQDS